MRLFTGIDLSTEVRSAIEQLLRKLRPQADINWSPVENLHITTKFIGEWPEERLKALEDALREVPAPEPFEIGIRGLGWFPNPHSPRIFWAGIDAPSSLGELAAATEQRLEKLGIVAEKRVFSPHLTLARVKKPSELGPLRGAIAALDSVDFGRFPVDRFHLYQSQTAPSGSRYRKLADFSLAST